MLSTPSGLRWLFFVAVGVIGVSLMAMARSVGEGMLRDGQRMFAGSWEAAVRRPASPLPLRPADEARFPRASFSLVIENDRGSSIDTRAGTVTYDRVADPDTTVFLVLEPVELDTLYREALAIRLFDSLALDPVGKDSPTYSLSPRYRLVASSGATVRELSWDWSAHMGRRWEADGKRLCAFVTHVWNIVARHPESRALPPARGVYY